MIIKLVEYFSSHPKKLFLIDGIGALFSSFLLGIVLVKLKYIFGIPVKTLYFLASFPIIFSLFDFYSYHKEKPKQKHLLKWIAFANILYCCLSISMTFYHYKNVTKFGWIYILIESIVVCTLSIIEFKTSKRIR